MLSTSVGFLCYDVSPASASTLNLLAQHIHNDFTLRAYPLFDTLPSGPLLFAYRPSTQRGRYFSFNTLSGKAPETTALNASLTTIRALVLESDIVCLLGIQGLPALLAAVLARIYRKPIVAINQTMGAEAERNRAAIIRVLKGWVLRNAAVNVAQTPPTIDTLHQVYGIPTQEIVLATWDGAAHEFLPILEQFQDIPKTILRQKLAIPATAYVVVFCGSLLYLKGVDVLIRGFCELARQTDDSILLVVGPDGGGRGSTSCLADSSCETRHSFTCTLPGAPELGNASTDLSRLRCVCASFAQGCMA